jgi:hypothetical protein
VPLGTKVYSCSMRSPTRGLIVRICLFALCVCSLARGQQQPQIQGDGNAQRYMASLKSGTICERRAAIVALHRLGKSAIPALIDHIDDGGVAASSTLMLANPLLSYVPPGSLRDEFSGVIYAYVIELILARDTLRDDKDCTFLLNNGDYAYPHGLIMKGNNIISATELAQVKQAYLGWWVKNRNENLASLRLEWKKSVRPLTGSGYSWV